MAKKMEPMLDSVTVKRSPAGGLGLFAKKPIPKGVFIIEYTGERISAEESEKRGGRYLFEVDEKITIDGKERGNIARYINHSCEPNCEAEEINKRILISSIRAIQPGEELFYDYGEEYFEEHIKPTGCQCPKHRPDLHKTK